MGFDISYHPMSKTQMEEWYFAPLKALRDGDESVLNALIESQGEEFFHEKFVDHMKYFTSIDEGEPSEKGLLYGLPIIGGFFRDYQYVRGAAFSFVIERHPEMDRYRTPWSEVLPSWIPAPSNDLIEENYSAGIFIGPDHVKELLRDIESDDGVRSILTESFGPDNLGVFQFALQDAANTDSGLIEATEVMEVQPFDLNKSTCYSDIRFCDSRGALIYREVALAQVREATGMNDDEIAENVVYKKTDHEVPEESAPKPEKKKGLLSKLFGKK